MTKEILSSKSVQDLPDPLEPGRVPSAAATDDMLARMADDAINQLMAQADADELAMRPLSARPTEPPRPEFVPEEVEPNAGDQTAQIPDALVPDALAAALEQRVTPLQADRSQTPESTPDTSEPDAMDFPAGNFDDVTPEPAADKKALLGDAEPAPTSASSSIALLPLRVVNAPFAKVSDSARNIVGQLGIITLINALAVLGYVLIFRRHH